MEAVYKPGDIVVAMWSYTMEWPEYYRVVSATAKSVLIVQLKRRVTANIDGYGQETYEVPTDETVGEPRRHMINPVSGTIRTGSRGSALSDARKWDGVPRYANYCD